jgi:hypothetical protein
MRFCEDGEEEKKLRGQNSGRRIRECIYVSEYKVFLISLLHILVLFYFT